MLFNLNWLILYQCIRYFIIQSYFVFQLGTSQNFPAEPANSKVCAEPKYTVQFTGPLCIPTGNNGWRPDTVENCEKNLKNECPEFNQAECLWYPWEPKDPTLKSLMGVSPFLLFPCCRLKYYATTPHKIGKYTWMEIFYTNQYGTSDTNKSVFDVVEIHRKIKNHKAFDNNEQDDWPFSVPDNKSERGLTWINKPDAPPFPSTITKQICQNGTDVGEQCKIAVNEYITKNFNDGFDKSKIPPKTEYEESHEFNITYSNNETCIKILIDNVKTDACKVAVIRTAFPTPATHFKLQKPNLTMTFCEGHVYASGNAIKLRYAYYSSNRTVKIWNTT